MALIGAAFGFGFTIGPLIAWAGEAVPRTQRSRLPRGEIIVVRLILAGD